MPGGEGHYGWMGRRGGLEMVRGLCGYEGAGMERDGG